MRDPLKELRQEQTRLRARQQSLSDQSDKATYASIGLGATGVALAFIPGLSIAGAVVLATAYLVPTTAISVSSLRMSQQEDKLNQKLTRVTAEIAAQNEYNQLMRLMNGSPSEDSKKVIENMLIERHIDRMIEQSVKEMERQIDSFDIREHYDYVDPSDFRRWPDGNPSMIWA